MKIFKSSQIREIDQFTIANEPIASIDLMERAAFRVYQWYGKSFDRARRVIIFAGPGNNGGDGLALARMLQSDRFSPEVYYVKFTDRTSPDWEKNYERLKETGVPFTIIDSNDDFPMISENDVVIDAIFGSGLTRPAEGLAADIIRMINNAAAEVVAIDIPSGLSGEDNTGSGRENIIRADHTVSFQFPKLAFMFAENEEYTGKWTILTIGLHEKAIANMPADYFFTEAADVHPIIKKRKKFDHKGMFGHGLLISGSYGKTGASVISARAALRTGIGLLTCHIPSCGYTVMQTTVPEAMIETGGSENYISGNISTDKYNAIGIGPGISTVREAQNVVHSLLSTCRKPVVIDADALNILGMNREWYRFLGSNVVLTPHPKEFERLTEPAENGYERMKKQIKFSQDHKCIVVLKGAYTSVSTQDGKVFFNSTGNPGMATGGSGDALTGMILSLLAQGYTPANAAIAGVYIHGLAGDIAAGKSSFESLLPSDIINETGAAFRSLETEDQA
jgi:NAD(P)H-hydrate epimerase